MAVDIDIPKAVDRFKETKIKAFPCHSNWVSSAGYECDRRLTYQRVAWQKKILHDVGLQYIFDEGNRIEASIRQELTDAGFELVEDQRPFNWPEKEISGKIDFKAVVKTEVDGKIRVQRIPIECKSINPYDFQTIKDRDIESVKNHKKPHVRGYLAQIMLYLLLDNVEWGILLFKDKNGGRYKQIDVQIDMAFLEQVIQKFERVNAAVKAYKEAQSDDDRAAALPARITDLTVCKHCPFRTECLPDVSFGEGIKIVSDAYLEQLLLKREATLASASEYDDADKELKELTKKRADNKEAHFIVNGRWELTVKNHGKGLRVDASRIGQAVPTEE